MNLSQPARSEGIAHSHVLMRFGSTQDMQLKTSFSPCSSLPLLFFYRLSCLKNLSLASKTPKYVSTNVLCHNNSTISSSQTCKARGADHDRHYKTRSSFFTFYKMDPESTCTHLLLVSKTNAVYSPICNIIKQNFECISLAKATTISSLELLTILSFRSHCIVVLFITNGMLCSHTAS